MNRSFRYNHLGILTGTDLSHVTVRSSVPSHKNDHRRGFAHLSKCLFSTKTGRPNLFCTFWGLSIPLFNFTTKNYKIIRLVSSVVNRNDNLLFIYHQIGLHSQKCRYPDCLSWGFVTRTVILFASTLML